MNRPPDAVVPRRFGLVTMLEALTLFSLTFLLLEWLKTPAWLVLNISLFLATVSLAQMLFATAPRQASVVAGTIYLPLAVVGMMIYLVVSYDIPLNSSFLLGGILVAAVSTLAGGALGYLVGTLMAGFFLVKQSSIQRRSTERRATSDDLSHA